MIAIETTVIEFQDARPDDFGRRLYFLNWVGSNPVSGDVSGRAQIFRSDMWQPGKAHGAFREGTMADVRAMIAAGVMPAMEGQ